MSIVNQSEPTVSAISDRTRPGVNHIDVTAPNGPIKLNIPTKPVPYHTVKRLMDILVSSCAMVLFSPLFVGTFLAVRLTSKGGAIFKQKRVGLGGKEFMCLKYRSMVTDAEELKQKLAHLNEASGPVFKMKEDPRITSVGRWIRRWSFDELPQLWNVFIGDMSIVGPRPPVPDEVAKYNQRQCGRLAVRPGITCLWQIMGRCNIGFDEWIELDLKYIETMSFWGDVMIVLKTIPAVIKGTGAH
ncbi:MAG: sugar transferase [Chthonomonadales bacterium]